MGFVVDTSVLVTMERERRPIADLTILWADDVFVIASVTAAELFYGVRRSNTPERLHRRQRFVDDILAAFKVVAFDVENAKVHADIAAELHRIGTIIGPHDLLIAATARHLGFAVLTENVREFQHVPGLDVRRAIWEPNRPAP